MKLKLVFDDYKQAPSQFKVPEYYLITKLGVSPIKTIIPGEFKDEIEGFSIEEITGVNTINFFVGANNSGKSRFLRGLFNTNIKESSIAEIFEEKSVSSLIDEIKNHTSTKEKVFNTDFNQLLRKLLDNVIGGSERPQIYLLGNINVKKKDLEEIIAFEIKDLDSNYKEIVDDFFRLVKELLSELEFWKANKPKEEIYIPPLRSLLSEENLNETNFLKFTENAYDIKNSDGRKILTGLETFRIVDKEHRSIRKRDLEAFSMFLNDNFFRTKHAEFFPNGETKYLSIAIDGKRFTDFNELGDGIQAIVLMLYPIYTAKPKTWFFIEEPETNLHPGFQRIFIETLLNDSFLKEKKHRYFFTTHSNHFLDLSIQSEETAIFQFKKEKENYHTIKKVVKPNKDVLDELGVNISSVFLANTALWVEGPTDRKYLSEFLKLYCKEKELPYLKEDIDFAFFEYGGNLIVHYIFDEEILEEDKEVRDKINSFASANKIYLLADSDNALDSSEKGKRRKTLEKTSNEKKNFKYQNTEVKEIENILPVQTLKSFMISLISNKEDSKKVGQINFKKTDYSKIGIGEFFEEKFKEVGITEFKSFKVESESGTLKSTYKTRLCQHFIDSEIKYEELIKDNVILKSLIKELYEFITS